MEKQISEILKTEKRWFSYYYFKGFGIYFTKITILIMHSK
mgnify:FL=1